MFLYTENNWKTFYALKKESKCGQEENNKDIEKEVKLRYELGEEKALIIINELKKIRDQFSLQKSDGYGHAFEIFAISVLYNIDYEIAYSNYIVKGSNDGKIDAIYWKDEKENIIYQIKMDFIEISDISAMRKNYLEFVTKGKISAPETSDLLSFCQNNKKEIKREKRCKVVTISNNNKEEKNITPDFIYKKYFENIFINRENGVNLSLSINQENGITKLSNKGDIFAYLTSAKDFIDDLIHCENINKKENLYKLFYDNVRGNLGLNKEIENTIYNEPNNFVKYNNGVTVTGSVEYIDETTTLIVKNPIINNGQQTIWNLVDKYPNIEDINLLIIVKNEVTYETKGKISRYTNSQKLIKPLDLLSLNSKIRDLQKNIFELTLKENGYFLELNSSGKRNYSNLVKKIYLKENIISLSDFCKLYFSVNDNMLGSWKSNVSTMVENVLSNNIDYDIEKSLMICKTISEYKKYIKSINDKTVKNILKGADLAFMFIMFKYNYDVIKTHDIINHINKKYYFDLLTNERKSKLIDLYKSNNIVKMIEDTILEQKKAKEGVTC